MLQAEIFKYNLTLCAIWDHIWSQSLHADDLH